MESDTKALPEVKKLLLEDMSLKIPEKLLHRFSIAPMMEVTNTHFRFFTRLFTRYSTLWTEMYHTNMLIHNEEGRNRALKFHPIEHPVVCQLGGNDPIDLSTAAKYVEEAGFDEVNINCGCPSERVSKGAFGACLMKDPETVAKCVEEMQKAVKIPVHVKCRIGVDDQDDYDFSKRFVEVIKNGGCQHVLVHARKAYLKGLNPT